MKTGIINILFTISGLILSAPLYPQDKGLQGIIESEKWLQEAFVKFYKSGDIKYNDSLNNEIIAYFSKILQSEETFFYPFTALDKIGKVRSEDNKLRVFTWHSQLNEKEYKYYGIIQVYEKKEDDQKLKVIVLNDKSEDLKNPETLDLNPETWYGSLYYGIQTYKYKRKTIYALQGYDFNGVFSDKKVLEILNVDKDGTISFGGTVQMEFQKLKRVIYEYSSQVVMTLRYDERLGMIVLDHLSPIEPIFTNNYSFYSQDGSYDGFRFEKGVFRLINDVDARNH